MPRQPVTPYVLTPVFSYPAGSIPFGYLLVRIFHGEDIRHTGSGNIGATNVSRKFPALGVLTLLLDPTKGFIPVTLTLLWTHRSAQAASLMMAMPEQADTAPIYTLASVAALFALLGHLFSGSL